MMNRRWQLLAEMIWTGLLVWSGYTLLAWLHPLLVYVVILGAAVNSVFIWLLQVAPQHLQSLYARPLGKRYVDQLCRWLGQQPPAGLHASASPELLLHSDEDFRNALWRARQIVRGQDAVLLRMLEQIRDAVRLRQRRRERSTQPPLATFLLVGRAGIGKRYLSRVMAQLLFPSGAVQVVACDVTTPAELFGNQTTPGELLEAIRQQPSQMIILERIEAASPELIRWLQPLLGQGVIRSPTTGYPISFSQTVVIITTTRGAAPLQELQQQGLTERAWQQQAVEVMTATTGLESSFLRGIKEVICCQAPSDQVKSEVTALLMLKECQAHGLTLVLVDPPLIAAEVLRIDDMEGFSRLPQSVSQLLRRPLLAASQQSRTSLSLRVRPRAFTPGVVTHV